MPADDEGLVDLTVYGPYGHAAEMLAVHAFFVAKDTGSQPSWQRGVYSLGMTAATHLVSRHSQKDLMHLVPPCHCAASHIIACMDMPAVFQL